MSNLEMNPENYKEDKDRILMIFGDGVKKFGEEEWNLRLSCVVELSWKGITFDEFFALANDPFLPVRRPSPDIMSITHDVARGL